VRRHSGLLSPAYSQDFVAAMMGIVDDSVKVRVPTRCFVAESEVTDFDSQVLVLLSVADLLALELEGRWEKRIVSGKHNDVGLLDVESKSDLLSEALTDSKLILTPIDGV
jgi:hypothetical protein